MNQKLIVDYIPLANSIAFKKKKFLPKCISLDELRPAAYFGLVDAAVKFDSSKGSFYNYACIRISGSIKDHLKSLCFFSINNSKEQKSEAVLDYNPTDTLDFFDFISSNIEDFECKIIKMYYLESKTMKEIGSLKGLSESRVSQIISKSHEKIKKVLERSI
jgi:RNA polymerase sigma factor (sigma-70 family)